jgi:threonine/homoserine/homoserine lactone efflux protein
VHEHLPLDITLKIGVLTLLIIVINVVWLVSGALLTRFFRDPRTNRIVNVAFAIALLASVVVALLA